MSDREFCPHLSIPYFTKLFVSLLLLIIGLIYIFSQIALLDQSLSSQQKIYEELRSEKQQNIPSLSACLIVRNEHNNLLEWIAYHYHTLPLRYLIIAHDPGSNLHPTHVLLQRWNTTKMGMTIVEWTGDKYLPKGYKKPKGTVYQWNYRQHSFMKKCMQTLKQANRTWTMLIDADEYLIYNRVGEGEPDDGLFEKQEDGYVILGDNDTVFNRQEAMKRLSLPPPNEHKTIAEYIMEEQTNYPWANMSCVLVPRLRFSLINESSNDTLYRNVPNGYDPTWFRTLKFFKHAKKNTLRSWTHKRKKLFPENGAPKSFVDVSKVGYDSLKIAKQRKPRTSVHFPITECMLGLGDSKLLRINHYTEDRERYWAKWRHAMKKDKEQLLDEKPTRSECTNYDMQGWLKSFVEAVGESTAKSLLEGIENFERWYNSTDVVTL